MRIELQIYTVFRLSDPLRSQVVDGRWCLLVWLRVLLGQLPVQVCPQSAKKIKVVDDRTNRCLESRTNAARSLPRSSMPPGFIPQLCEE